MHIETVAICSVVVTHFRCMARKWSGAGTFCVLLHGPEQIGIWINVEHITTSYTICIFPSTEMANQFE